MTKARAGKSTAAPKRQRLKIDKTAEIKIAKAPEGEDNSLLDTANTALWLDVSHQWLEKGRCKGYGPPYVKQGRLVHYRKGDIIEYLRSRRIDPTAEVS
jgi:hypothetical protein